MKSRERSYHGTLERLVLASKRTNIGSRGRITNACKIACRDRDGTAQRARKQRQGTGLAVAGQISNVGGLHKEQRELDRYVKTFGQFPTEIDDYSSEISRIFIADGDVR
jgi:hypothetical protein